MKPVRLRAGSATDVGLVRSNNQDQYLVAEPLYAVADGMGGAAAGEVASAIAVRTLGEELARRGGSLTPDELLEAAQTANRAVWEESIAHSEMRGMGTTLVAATLVESGTLAVINVGDSRLYSMRDGAFRQVTVDHNLVAEMVAEGRISKEEGQVHPRRNIMTRALGVEPEVPVDLFVEEAIPGDRFLLCSDGLPRELSDDRISAILRRLSDPSAAAKELVHEAKRRGGNDNITVIVINVLEDHVEPPSLESAGSLVAGAAAPPVSGEPESESEPGDEETKLLDVVGTGSAKPGEHRRERPAKEPRASLVTLRVAAFVAAFVLIVAAGAAGVWYYARSSYFVGVRGNTLAVYQGRPGGVLWIEPTLNHRSSVTTAQVLEASLASLHAGVEEPTIAAADAYIANLASLFQRSRAAAQPPPTTPTTTTPSSTATSTATSTNGSSATISAPTTS